MTNQELLQIALQQSAIDCNCKPEDFLQNENIVTESRKHPSARSYLPLPFACDLVSYGNNIVAQVREDLRDTVQDYINTYPPEYAGAGRKTGSLRAADLLYGRIFSAGSYQPGNPSV